MKEIKKSLEIYKRTRTDKDKRTFFIALYDHYYESVLLYVRSRNRKDAEDITQELFLKFCRINPERFLDALPRLNSYIFEAAKNACIDYYNKHGRNQNHSELLEDLVSNVGHSDPIQDLENKFLKQKALASLPKRQRVALVLYSKGYKYKEIADQLSISISAVKNLILRARKNLQVINQKAS